MKVVMVVGPTAVGKSQKAIQMAEELGGVILNSDSQQFYDRLFIGTAAPSEEDKKRVPHFLFNKIPPPQVVTAGWFYREAMNQLEQLKQAGCKFVFIVGGTGFYLDVLENGLLPIGGENPDLRSELESKVALGGALELYAELKNKDPESANKIKPQDHYRIVRAVEIIRTTGQSVSQIKKQWAQNKPAFPFELVKIGFDLPKPDLEKRVTLRTQQMLEQGLIQEVQNLVDEGFQNWSALKSVGYLETLQFLNQAIKDEQELEQAIIKSTMRLIKKQKTWFKRYPDIKWFTPSSSIGDLCISLNKSPMDYK